MEFGRDFLESGQLFSGTGVAIFGQRAIIGRFSCRVATTSSSGRTSNSDYYLWVFIPPPHGGPGKGGK